MSTLKATNLQHKDSSDPNVVLYSDGSTSIRNLQNLQRNMVDNGAMVVAQRSSKVEDITGGGVKTIDRFSNFIINLGTWTDEQVKNDAPPGFGFAKKLTCTTADASPAANDRLNISHVFEGYSLDPARTGPSSGMRSLQLSFWVKSNKAGKASVNIYQPKNTNRMVVLVYEIEKADTWEHIHLTAPADSSAVIPADNQGSLVIEWWLNSGSDYQGGVAQPAWGALTNANRNINNLGVGGAVNDYFAMTGVQLTATDAPIEFQYEDPATTLVKCQRHFERKNLIGHVMVKTGLNSEFRATYFYKVEKRGGPDVSKVPNDGGSLKVQPGGTPVTNLRFQWTGTNQVAVLVDGNTSWNSASFEDTVLIDISAEL